MRLPQKGSDRIAALILIGLLFGVIVVAGIAVILAKQKPTMIPIEDAMWVTDWDLKEIYGPGTPEQRRIVEQLGPDWKFETPVLYRMGGTKKSDPSEIMLFQPFDPEHPEVALKLMARQNTPNKTP